MGADTGKEEAATARTGPSEGRDGERIHVGTSGWHYGHWRGVFYPPEVSPPGYLTFYAGHFDTVEVNNTFYQLPKPETMDVWRTASPPGFCFAVKASQYITHRKRLKEPERTLTRFFDLALRLGDKLGPILFQLPPRFRVNLERLDAFLAALPVGPRYAFEFRDHSWFVPEVEEMLRRYDAAFCIYDQAGLVTPLWATGPLVYLRLHGAGEPYQGSYPDDALARYARLIRDWAAGDRDVYCYFNNDPFGNAIFNAKRLMEMLGLERSASG